MSKKIKTLVSTLVIAMALSTTAFAAPINTTNTFDGGKGADIVTQANGTETQYYQDYFGTIFNNLPVITKTVTQQSESGNTLRYDLNLISNSTSGGSDVEHHILDTTYMTVNNIERESGFGIERLLYSHNPVTITMQGTQLFKCKEIQKVPKYVMDNGNLAYVELNGDSSKYPVSTLDTGLNTYELKEPGLYLVMFDKVDAYTRIKGIHCYVYIAQAGENITNTATSKVAVPSTIDFNVDEKHTLIPTYSLSGSNYIRIRDLAYILNGTGKQISIAYNAGTDTTSINTTGSLDNQSNSYVANGTELTALPAYTSEAEPSVHKLAKNGSILSPSMYTINEQDFISLKALASILGLNMQVYSDGIMIDTSTNAVSSSPIAVLVNSSAIGYATKLEQAKLLGYPAIDVANKSTEQVMSELAQVQGLTTVKVWDPKYTSDLINAIRTKYRQQF